MNENISIFDENEYPCVQRKEEKVPQNYHQFTYDGSIYSPCGPTMCVLPAGIYNVEMNRSGFWEFRQNKRNTYDLIKFESSIGNDIIEEFKYFWQRKDEYVKRNEPHKRGYLFCGPPGGGKTCIVRQIIDDFVKDGNVVFLFEHNIPTEGIKAFREVEPNRKALFVLEDIDALLRFEDYEQELLRLLDGNVQYTNTVTITTTNYPEKLPDRIINRPSRIDRIVTINMPDDEMREKYIINKSKKLKNDILGKMIKDTKNFSFGHIKELIISAEVYGLPYEEALGRLLTMRKKQVKSSDWDDKLHDKECNGGIGFRN